ncbi:hypothetical protein Dsin_017590 [Dipteronia sinensis]|uniref:Uncharacterized protein n=1 Tax=Dipteronia sinensis TaxID=43782 RepID=A0AAE0E6P6_9ROSI|nr:hypothetical protein Dsin_017590 [Dipteronia sinensis]
MRRRWPHRSKEEGRVAAKSWSGSDSLRRVGLDPVQVCGKEGFTAWILMGLDEREEIPVWQIQLVEDLIAFDAFSWGAHMYRQSIYGFKHALDCRYERFKRRQHENTTDVHTVETYNIYGLPQALLIFAFEVIPELWTQFRTRRDIDLSPRILKWELKKQPRSEKLDKIFTSKMFARTALVPTAAKRVARYYEGIDEGGSLYTASDRDHVSVQDPVDVTTARPSYTALSPLRHRRDTEDSEPEVGGRSP